MRKLIFLVPFLIFSCGESEKVEITKEEYNKLKGSEYPKKVTIDDEDWEITLGSDGHEYCDNNGISWYICFHYPECKKCKQNEVKRDSILSTTRR